jgi:phage baseplate assembly protein W
MGTGINYIGIAFPFQAGDQAVPKVATDEDLIKQSIVQIIMTQPGERYMNPEFGCGALNFVFEPQGAGLTSYIQQTVQQAIARWETRVVVNSVTVEKNDMFDSQVVITVYYTVTATSQTQSVQVTLGSP